MILDAIFEEDIELMAEFAEKIDIRKIVIESLVIEKKYALSESYNTAPTNWEVNPLVMTPEKPYLWCKTIYSGTTEDGENFAFTDNGIVIGIHGKTPVKGVDYFTPTEKKEIVDEVLGEIPESGGGSGGGSGEDGATFTPAVSADGVISWTNDKGLPNPTPVNIKGVKGDAGTSITVSKVTVSSADGGNNVVTFSDGNTVTILNGNKGNPGEPGYTPQKGTDYWTAFDIAEIKSYVDDAILGGEW